MVKVEYTQAIKGKMHTILFAAIWISTIEQYLLCTLLGTQTFLYRK